MLKRWLRYLSLYWKFQKQNIKSLAEYKADFVMLLFFTGFSQLCTLAVLGILYSNIPQIQGWNLWEILWLYSFLLFSEGCINFFFQGTWKIAQMINAAELDRFLVRPVPVGLQVVTARIDFDGLHKMLIASAVFLLGVSHCSVSWSPGKVLLLLVFLLESCILRVCMIWLASCASFWMEGGKNNLNFFLISIGEMAKYPLTIYPPLLKNIFAYLIPYAFVSYYPAGYLLGKEGMTAGVLLTPLVCLLLLLLSKAALTRGLARYESSGN